MSSAKSEKIAVKQALSEACSGAKVDFGKPKVYSVLPGTVH
jgi:hypothetical protein